MAGRAFFLTATNRNPMETINQADLGTRARQTLERLEEKAASMKPENTPRDSASGSRAKSEALARSFPWQFRHKGNNELKAAFRAAGAFAVDFCIPDTPGRSLAILGKSGTGKTHLAMKCLSFWREFRKSEKTTWKQGHSYAEDGRRFSVAKCFRWTDYTHKVNERDWDSVNRMVAAAHLADFLVLDDMFATDGTPAVAQHAREAIQGIIETRVTARRWTVLTSNLSYAQIAERDARISSRLIRNGSEFVEILDAPDFNLR